MVGPLDFQAFGGPRASLTTWLKRFGLSESSVEQLKLTGSEKERLPCGTNLALQAAGYTWTS